MSRTVIKVENLAKAYRIGVRARESDTLAGTLLNVLKSPIKNFRDLRNLRDLNNDAESLFWALNDLSFEVFEGEVVGIIGHNGAGKSTLLKILSRITEPTRGRVIIEGRVSSLLEVGTGFHPDLSGRENIYMNGTILGMRKREIDSKLEEIVEFSGISRHLDTPVKRYSSGMAVRLAFSVAAHLEPDILVIDEVLAVGDMEFQKRCLGKMDDVAKKGRTVLFVSHNLGFVDSLCKRGIVLKGGVICFNGSAKGAIAEYTSEYLKKSSQYLAPPSKSGIFIKDVNLVTSESFGIQMVNKSFEVHFLIQTPVKLVNPSLSFQLVNSQNVPVVHVLNLNTEVPFCQETGTTKLSCKMPNLRLYPGLYSLTLNFNKGWGQVNDGPLKNICVFEVIRNQNRDLYWYENAATYLEDCEWTAENL